MRLLLICFIAAFVMGCCTANSKTDGKKKFIIPVSLLYTSIRPNYIEPEFERYVEDFEKLYKVEVDSPMYFESHLDGNHIGECWTFDDGYKEIVIEKEWWEKAPILRRRALIFHELAHYYDQDHRNEEYKDKCPKSLMNKTIATQKCLRKYWKTYEKELLSGKNNNSVRRPRDKRFERTQMQSRFYQSKKTSKPISSCCR